jgi:hypothetical protein
MISPSVEKRDFYHSAKALLVDFSVILRLFPIEIILNWDLGHRMTYTFFEDKLECIYYLSNHQELQVNRTVELQNGRLQ